MQDPTIPGAPGATPPVLAPVPGALCAKHPTQQAYGLCTRCGSYMCLSCSEQGHAQQCPDCRARTGGSAFPFTRDNYTVEKIVEHSWRVWKAHWQTLIIAALVYFGITYGVAFVFTFAAAIGGGLAGRSTGAMSGIQGAGQAAQMVLQVWLQLGMFAITLEVLEGKNPGVGVVFSRANRLGTGFGQLLLMYLAMLLILSPLGFAFLLHEDLRWKVLGGGMLVLAIPLAYVGMGFAFSMLEIAYNPKATALSAIKTSFALVSGHRWRIVLMGVASVAIIFAGVLACCVGVVPAFGLATTVFCSMYLALRNGSDQLAG